MRRMVLLVFLVLGLTAAPAVAHRVVLDRDAAKGRNAKVEVSGGAKDAKAYYVRIITDRLVRIKGIFQVICYIDDKTVIRQETIVGYTPYKRELEFPPGHQRAERCAATVMAEIVNNQARIGAELTMH